MSEYSFQNSDFIKRAVTLVIANNVYLLVEILR